MERATSVLAWPGRPMLSRTTRGELESSKMRGRASQVRPEGVASIIQEYLGTVASTSVVVADLQLCAAAFPSGWTLGAVTASTAARRRFEIGNDGARSHIDD